MRTGQALVLCFAATLVLSGCSRNRIDPGPDEFRVIPRGELTEPANYSDLPAPGGYDQAVTSSFAMARAALGGTRAETGPMNGAGAVQPAGWGFLSGLFGGGARSNDVLDPDTEARRLRSLGYPVF